MFIIDPDPYSTPCYRIGPFQTRDVSFNHTLPDSDRIDKYFQRRFGEGGFIFTINGRQAINCALTFYNLQKEDIVTILTTSGNFYISGCVTSEIEKFCRWSRDIESGTKLLIVNHEFGYPYQGIDRLKELNLPIIEDCAGSFFSKDRDMNTGRVGDFVIYSFPKMFPLQVGGLLVSNGPAIPAGNNYPDPFLLSHIKNVMSHYLNSYNEIISKRLVNYRYLRDALGSLDLAERFELVDGVVPGVFMFKTEHLDLDLPELKNYCYAHGIQCSVFYGEKAFFIPVHQRLTEQDMDYFYEVLRSFINKAGS